MPVFTDLGGVDLAPGLGEREGAEEGLKPVPGRTEAEGEPRDIDRANRWAVAMPQGSG